MVSLFRLYELCRANTPEATPGVANLLLAWWFTTYRAELETYFSGTGVNASELMPILDNCIHKKINLNGLIIFAITNSIDYKFYGRDLLHAIIIIENNPILINLKQKGLNEVILRNNIFGQSGCIHFFNKMFSDTTFQLPPRNCIQKKSVIRQKYDSEEDLPKEELDKMIRTLFRKYWSQ